MRSVAEKKGDPRGKKENIWRDFLNKINSLLMTKTSCITKNQKTLDLEPQSELGRGGLKMNKE